MWFELDRALRRRHRQPLAFVRRNLDRTNRGVDLATVFGALSNRADRQHTHVLHEQLCDVALLGAAVDHNQDIDAAVGLDKAGCARDVVGSERERTLAGRDLDLEAGAGPIGRQAARYERLAREDGDTRDLARYGVDRGERAGRDHPGRPLGNHQRRAINRSTCGHVALGDNNWRQRHTLLGSASREENLPECQD